MMLAWCELCNNAPASGILTVIRDGRTEPMPSCQDCVDKLKPEDWITNDL